HVPIDDQPCAYWNIQLHVKMLVTHQVVIRYTEMAAEHERVALLLEVVIDFAGTFGRLLIRRPMCRILVGERRRLEGIHFHNVHICPALTFQDVPVTDDSPLADTGYPV